MEDIEKEIEDEKKRLIREREQLYIQIQNKIRLDEDKFKNQISSSNLPNFKRQSTLNNNDLGMGKVRNYEKEIDYEQDRLNNDIEMINIIYNNMNEQAEDLWKILKIEKLENLLKEEKEKIKNFFQKKILMNIMILVLKIMKI